MPQSASIMYRKGSSGDQSRQSATGIRTSSVVSVPVFETAGWQFRLAGDAAGAGLPHREREGALVEGGPSFRTTACTRTTLAAMSGAVCTLMKWGVPLVISSTESKMPGM